MKREFKMTTTVPVTKSNSFSYLRSRLSNNCSFSFFSFLPIVMVRTSVTKTGTLLRFMNDA